MIEPRKPIHSEWLGFMGIALLALAVRAIGLSRQSLWLDEMTSIEAAQRPLSLIVTGQGFDNHTPPLYYFLLHFWSRLVPLTESGLRIFSAVIEPVNVLLLALLCRRFLPLRSTILVTCVYAISPFMIYYAQEGRMYTWLVFWGLAYSLSMERIAFAEARLGLRTLLAGTLLALGLYTHYFFAFFACALLSAAMLSCRKSPKRLRAILISGVLGTMLFSPWIPIALRLAGSGGQSFRTYIWSVIPYTFYRFVVGYAVFPLNMHSKDDYLRSVAGHAPELILVFVTLLFLILSLLLTIRGRRPASFAIAACILLAPMLIALIVSLKAPILSERYLIMTFPFFLMVILGAQDLERPFARISIGIFVLVTLGGTIAYFFNPEFGKAQWREVAAYITEISQEGDIVLIEPDYTAGVFKYYYGNHRQIESLPPQRERNRTPDLRRKLSAHSRAILISSGHFAGSDYTPWLMQFAARTHIRVFPLETGITCTIWDIRKLPSAETASGYFLEGIPDRSPGSHIFGT